MISLQAVLATCPLFSKLSEAELGEISRRLRPSVSVKSYAREQVIAFEDDPCSTLGIVASGSVHIQRIFGSGKTITLETFRAGDSFGEALMFADSGLYPATLLAQEDSQIVFLSREEVVELCSRSPAFLSSFMTTLSNRILLLNGKIKSLTYGSLRQKVAHYLLEERRRQGTPRLALPYARHELADALGIPRPSLSRELAAMKEAGWIDFDRRAVTLLDPRALEDALSQ